MTKELELTEIQEQCAIFMIKNKVSFETLIRCANFWNDLRMYQKDELIKAYEDGVFNGYGWH